jgi:hypothetical protein
MITTTEHLQLIKAECERLLSIAEKRTQGEWSSPMDGLIYASKARLFDIGSYSDGFGMEDNDATFIADCAGRAEAGWRATIAAIDGLLIFYTLPNVEAPNEVHQVWEHDAEIAEESLNLILAAWPIELLTNKPQA